MNRRSPKIRRINVVSMELRFDARICALGSPQRAINHLVIRCGAINANNPVMARKTTVSPLQAARAQIGPIIGEERDLLFCIACLGQVSFVLGRQSRRPQFVGWRIFEGGG